MAARSSCTRRRRAVCRPGCASRRTLRRERLALAIIRLSMKRAFPPRSADTTPEAELVHIELIRAASPARRAHQAFSLSADVIGAARRAFVRARPLASAIDLDLQLWKCITGASWPKGFEQNSFVAVASVHRRHDSVASRRRTAARHRRARPYYIGGSLASSTHRPSHLPSSHVICSLRASRTALR
jgi:hypothetical protein